MAIDLYWGSGSAYCARVLLALEHKGLEYRSHLLKFDQQEHQAPQMLAMNPRGQLPVLRDNDYVVFESVGILYYLDRKYPDPPLFGRSPEEAGVIMRVIGEYQAYAEPSLMQLVRYFLYGLGPAAASEDQQEALAAAMHRVASEARTIERRLAQSDWVVGEKISATDLVIYPDIRLLLRALAKPAARELAARFLPVEINYPALGRWLARVAAVLPHTAQDPVIW
jgi:glutathione S-transferase